MARNFSLYLNILQLNPFSNDLILDPSKHKQSANYNSKFDENGREFSERVENTVGKGGIAHEQFLLFPQSFQKTCHGAGT